MSQQINEANSVMSIIWRTMDHMDELCFTTNVKSLVCPHIEYANEVWTPSLMNHITALKTSSIGLPNEFTVFKVLDYKELQRLKLPTLVYRRLRGDMIELYKIFT